MQEKNLLGTKEACRYLAVSPSTLARLVKAKRIDCFRPSTGSVKPSIRFSMEQLDRFLQSTVQDRYGV